MSEREKGATHPNESLALIGLLRYMSVIPPHNTAAAKTQTALPVLQHVIYLPFLSGLRVGQEIVTSYPQVAVVRVPTPWVQSDSDITVLRHLEKLGCRLVNRPQAILNCVNKFWTFQELAGHGVPLPDTYSYGERSSLCLLMHHSPIITL